MIRIGLVVWAAALVSIPLRSSAQTVAPRGNPIDEAYRGQFVACDASDKFGQVQFPILAANGRVRWYGCRTDPSRFTRFERKPAEGNSPEAIIVESKLARDDDGSPKACNTPGLTDQCATSLMLKPTAAHPCPKVLAHQGTHCLPIDASVTPYVVIPTSAPAGIDGRAFRVKSGLTFGDVGVVLANGKQVSVVIADGGPAYKMGEGSMALLKALSNDGQPHTLPRGAVLVLFPHSSLGADASADTFYAEVTKKAEALYARLTKP